MGGVLILIPVDEVARTSIGCCYFLRFLGNIYQKIVSNVCVFFFLKQFVSIGAVVTPSASPSQPGQKAGQLCARRLSFSAEPVELFALAAAGSPRRLVPALRSAASRGVRFNRDREGERGIFQVGRPSHYLK